MSLTVLGLAPKFAPHILRNSACPASQEVADQIDAEFAQRQALKGDYVQHSEHWVFKKKRTDGVPATDDAHAYRVRKAERLRNYIQENNLGDFFVVPQKWLYEREGEVYVVSQKLGLSEEVVALSPQKEAVFRGPDNAVHIVPGTQLYRLNQDVVPRRALTAQQVKGLAEMVFLGLTDLSYNNLFFTVDGKFAILDTDPESRAVKKDAWKGLVFRLLGSKEDVRFAFKMTGMRILKIICSGQQTFHQIQEVEKRPMMIQAAKLVVKAVVTLFMAIAALVFLPEITIFGGAFSVTNFVILSCSIKKLNMIGVYLDQIYDVRNM